MEGAGGPTVPAWLGSWAPGLVYGPRVYSVPEWRRDHPRNTLTIYTYGHRDNVKLRLGWSGTARPAWERPVYPIDREPWHLAVPLPPPQHPGQQLYNERAEVAWSAGGARGEGAGWARAARGWCAGAALLALLVLLARAAERCIDRRLFKRRRRSQEWVTPHVRATSQCEPCEGVVVIPGLEDASPLPAPRADAPPPYSACEPLPSAPLSKVIHRAVSEEPPPPYSDCYVEFSNKGPPSVLIYTRRPEHENVVATHNTAPDQHDTIEPEGQHGIATEVRHGDVLEEGQNTVNECNVLRVNMNDSSNADEPSTSSDGMYSV